MPGGRGGVFSLFFFENQKKSTKLEIAFVLSRVWREGCLYESVAPRSIFYSFSMELFVISSICEALSKF